jgi:hypothetical protein
MSQRRFQLKGRHLHKPLEVVALDSSNRLADLTYQMNDKWLTGSMLAMAVIQTDDGHVVDEWWNEDEILACDERQRWALRKVIPGFPTEALLAEMIKLRENK